MTAVSHRAPQTHPALLEVNELVREYALPREHLFRLRAVAWE